MDTSENTVPAQAIANYKWWAVVALYESLHPEVYQSQKLCELRVILVDANDMEEAERIGLDLARAYEAEYLNVYGELVVWKLKKIDWVSELMDRKIGHGVEVYHDWIVKKTPRGKKPRRKPIMPQEA